jgi:proline iminopeptidase
MTSCPFNYQLKFGMLNFERCALLILSFAIFKLNAQTRSSDSVYLAKVNANGVKMVTIDGTYKVWTQKVGSGEHKVLLLHGGPGFTHELLESFADYLPKAGIEIYFYEQLGCYFSDQPDDTSLWNIYRYSDEVEQVRQALGLTKFFLFGHSWGGQLALQYAVDHPDALMGLIVSNATFSEEATLDRIESMEQRIINSSSKLKLEYQKK